MAEHDPQSEPASSVEHLEGLADFKSAVDSICARARRDLALFSPDLDAPLFDRDELADALSALARRHRQTRVRLLVRDTRPLIERGHGLVRLAQRLPSKISVRRLTNEIETRAHSFLLCDRDQLLYRNDPEEYRGFVDRKGAAEVRNLREIFDRAWESAEEDPRLRQLFV
ncbi:DUF7931 domain-containing protein [Marinimicrobium sp. C2-29]|uniref:DUF7931 domain-containing protein n=1 Tax=Marinimicrobium sp. C2-29 TaxID=3139825 RepID=UPI00313A0797